jgi:hypothetical protein
MRFAIAPPNASAPTEAFATTYLLNGCLTILNKFEDSVKDPIGVSLRALGWVLADTERAKRFLAVTGLDPDGLRAAIGQPATHLAVLDFLCAHEPDLLAAADSLGVAPAELAAARDRIAP